VAHLAGFVGLPLAACLLAYRSAPGVGIASARLFLLLALLLPIGWIGLFEGGYNHVVKGVPYWFGGANTLWSQWLPPPMYEPPTDFWFEASGMLQFVVALWAIRAAWQVWAALR
jgi:hypothetical protein